MLSTSKFSYVQNWAKIQQEVTVSFYCLQQAIEQGLDLTEVDRQHASERETLEGEYEAEQSRHEVEITKRVNKEHVHDVKKH